VSIKQRKDRAEKLEKVGLSYFDDPAIEWNYCETDPYFNDNAEIYISKIAEK